MQSLPKNLQQEITQKGFVVYHYISFFELMQTVKRDYLSVLTKINIPFALITVGYIFFTFDQGLGGIFAYFIFAYSLIFLYLFFRLLLRTRDYFHVSDVVFTTEGIILGGDIVKYLDQEKKEKLLLQYEEIFDEYLTKPSKILKVIDQQRKKLVEGTINIFGFALKATTSNLNSRNTDIRFTIIVGFILTAYSVFLFLFYYIGIFFGYIFFALYAGILSGILFFSKKIEIKMKNSVTHIDTNLRKLLRIESVLQKKIENFSEGEISDISGFIGKNFSKFYSLIHEIIEEKNSLEISISKSKYKDFIDFKIFSSYILLQYKKPVVNITQLLQKNLASVQQQKEEIFSLDTKSSASAEEFSANITQKKYRFENMEKILQSHIQKLEVLKNSGEKLL